MIPTQVPVAVLYQKLDAPVIDGVRKPVKPGGYSDSGADIAFNLREAGTPVVTPTPDPDPSRVLDWVFPDTPEGIDRAVAGGARILWANTILFDGHPLHLAGRSGLRVVGQDPGQVQKLDDKWYANELLRSNGLPVAKAVLIGPAGSDDAVPLDVLSTGVLHGLGLAFPLVVKPVRGRGSEGVARVATFESLRSAAGTLLGSYVNVDGLQVPTYGRRIILEEYLPGTEITVTVMPPGAYTIGDASRTFDRHWCLPPVRRFNHEGGIAPYNGVVAVTSNSRVLAGEEMRDAAVESLCVDCAAAAGLVGARAPIRIDCRQGANEGGRYLLFDLNMKPNMTGPGRPGREDQDSLSSMAARGIGWSYRDLIVNLVRQSWPAS